MLRVVHPTWPSSLLHCGLCVGSNVRIERNSVGDSSPAQEKPLLILAVGKHCGDEAQMTVNSNSCDTRLPGGTPILFERPGGQDAMRPDVTGVCRKPFPIPQLSSARVPFTTP